MSRTRSVRRALWTAVAVLLLVLVGRVDLADATPYDHRPHIFLDPTTPHPGSSVRVVGIGFAGDRHVSIHVEALPATTVTRRTNPDGMFTALVALPQTSAGMHSVIVTDSRTGQRTSQPFRASYAESTPERPVSPPTTPPPPAASPSDSGGPDYADVAIVGLGAVALVLLGGGILLLVTGRRRNRP